MKIYTKTGDKGKTSLFGGKRVPKDDAQIEAYGTVDELNSWIGLLRDQNPKKHDREFLIAIQSNLFILGSHLAADTGKVDQLKLPAFDLNSVTALEQEMDKMNEGLPDMTHFILPGGHLSISYCHIARTVCRRAERRVAIINQKNNYDIFLKYLNRLSDYLFVLSRKWGADNKVTETPWIP